MDPSALEGWPIVGAYVMASRYRASSASRAGLTLLGRRNLAVLTAELDNGP